jgi:isopenicillin-N epimerase
MRARAALSITGPVDHDPCAGPRNRHVRHVDDTHMSVRRARRTKRPRATLAPVEAVSPLDRWALSPDVVHLNHGSYGGCPRAVVDAAASWRVRLEEAPMRFFVLEWQIALDRARGALAAFVRAPDRRLAFVTNATTGVAIALHASTVADGDDILTTDHAYRACKNQLARLAAERGARVVVASLPWPFDADAAVDAITAAITPRTRLALIDHLSSPTALRLPLERIVAALAAREIAIVVDGAHAPGQLELDVASLLEAGVTWYAGNCHKWMCAPKSAGFLVTAPHAPVLPLVTSHGASPEYGPPNRLHAELDWIGTHDPSPYLAVPSAIASVGELGGDWPRTIARNHALAIEMRRRLIDALGGGARHTIAPDDALGAMAAIPIALPQGVAPLALQQRLLGDGWEVPIVDFHRGPLVRVSAHLYNDAAQVDALASKLRALGVAVTPLS